MRALSNIAYNGLDFVERGTYRKALMKILWMKKGSDHQCGAHEIAT